MNFIRQSKREISNDIVSFAIGIGDPQKIAVLIEAGADIRYQREHGYLSPLQFRIVARYGTLKTNERTESVWETDFPLRKGHNTFE